MFDYRGVVFECADVNFEVFVGWFFGGVVCDICVYLFCDVDGCLFDDV